MGKSNKMLDSQAEQSVVERRDPHGTVCKVSMPPSLIRFDQPGESADVQRWFTGGMRIVN